MLFEEVSSGPAPAETAPSGTAPDVDAAELANLLASGGVATVVLGGDLRIRRFTPAAARLLGLLAGDVGRPIAHLKAGVELPDMEALVGEVIASVQPQEREVIGPDGRCYLLRVHPYRTAELKLMPKLRARSCCQEPSDCPASATKPDAAACHLGIGAPGTGHRAARGPGDRLKINRRVASAGR